MALALLSLGLLFFLGHGLRWFFLKTKIPDLLLLVVIGYLAGPVLGFIDPSDLGKVGGILSTVALVVILYEGGLELHAKDLARSSGPAIIIAALGFLMIVSLATALAFLVAMQDWPTSLLFGLALGCVSAAVVIPMVKQLSISKTSKTLLSLESAFTDVITIVIFLVIVDAFASGNFSINQLIYGIGPKTLSAVVFGTTSGLVWAWVRSRFPFLSDITFSGEAWAVFTYGLLELGHYNGVLGVFALGFTLANLNLLPDWIQKGLKSDPVSVDEMSLLGELSFLLRTFFFIYLGLLVQFNDWKTVLFAAAIALLLPITRFVAMKIFFRQDQLARIDAIMITAMGPRGLATAVLATIPLQRGMAGGEWIQSTLFAVIPISIFITAAMVFFGENPRLRRSRLMAPFHSYEDELSSDKANQNTGEESNLPEIKS